MGYEITIDDQHGCVELRLFGAAPHAQHTAARDEVLAICRARDIHQILIDARELRIENTSTIQLFDFGVEWAERAKHHAVSLAGVLPFEPTAQRQVRFGDTVAFNRGMNTRAFDDIEKARAWLWALRR